MEEVWEIEKIIKHRISEQTDQYLVKWEGYDGSYNSWHTVEDLLEILLGEEPILEHHLQIFEERLDRNEKKLSQKEKITKNRKNHCVNNLPNEQLCIKAIGLSNASPQLKILLKPQKDIFPLLELPKQGDWLYHEKETPQTFFHYKRLFQKKKLKQRLKKKKICLLPIKGSWDCMVLEILSELLKCYYCAEVVILPVVNIVENSESSVKLVTREKEFTIQSAKINGKVRLQVKDIQHMLKTLLKSDYTDASLMVALTDRQISSDKFASLFGQADLDSSVCVVGLRTFLKHCSFQQFVWHSSSVLIHEIGHLFGLDHCIYYECVMNGTNSLVELQRQPLFLCPVCLHKLYHAMEFDVVRRYVELLEFYERHECFIKEKVWVERRLKQIRG